MMKVELSFFFFLQCFVLLLLLGVCSGVGLPLPIVVITFPAACKIKSEKKVVFGLEDNHESTPFLFAESVLLISS